MAGSSDLPKDTSSNPESSHQIEDEDSKINLSEEEKLINDKLQEQLDDDTSSKSISIDKQENLDNPEENLIFISSGGEGQLNPKNFEVTQEEFDRINSMINGIAWSKNGWSGLHGEDLVIELWIRAMDVMIGMGVINYNIIAWNCWHRVYDLCRKAKRDKSHEFEATDYINAGCLDDSDDVASNSLVGYSEDDKDSSLMIDDIINLFDENSKECDYVKLVGIYTGSLSSITTRDGKPIKNFNEVFGQKRMEYEIATKLGFANDTSSGYRNLRYRVRKAILDNYLK